MKTVESSAAPGAATGNGEQTSVGGERYDTAPVSSFGHPGPVTSEDLGERRAVDGGRSCASLLNELQALRCHDDEHPGVAWPWVAKSVRETTGREGERT